MSTDARPPLDVFLEFADKVMTLRLRRLHQPTTGGPVVSDKTGIEWGLR